MNNNYFIYYILDPRNSLSPKEGERCYVGLTNNILKRISSHLHPNFRNTKTKNSRWLQSLKSVNLKPIFSIRCIVETKEEACRLEIALINKLKQKGCQLTNLTIGGEGGNGPMSPEALAALRERMKSPQIRAKISASRKGVIPAPHSKESRQQAADKRRGFKHTAEAKEKIRQGHLGKPMTEETKLAISNSTKGVSKPERSVKISGAGNPNCSLVLEDVIKIRNLYSKYDVTRKELANTFEVHESTINCILSRKTWKNV